MRPKPQCSLGMPRLFKGWAFPYGSYPFRGAGFGGPHYAVAMDRLTEAYYVAQEKDNKRLCMRIHRTAASIAAWYGKK